MNNVIPYKLNLKLYRHIMLILLISTCIYWLDYYIFKYIPLPVDKILNNTSTIIICLFALIPILIRKKIYLPKQVIYFAVMIVVMTLTSIVSNSPTEYIPSLLRYSLYLFIFGLAYHIGKNSNESLSKKNYLSLNNFVILAVCLTIFFGFIEILLEDRLYFNGQFRSSGQFYQHPLAFALFLNIIIILWLELFVNTIKWSMKNIIYIFILLLLVYFLLSTGSRLQIVALLVSYFIYYFFRIGNLTQAIKYLIYTSIVVLIITTVITQTTVAPRLSYMLAGKHDIFDSSTLLRVTMSIESINNLDPLNYIIGIGLGGFSDYYSSISRFDQIAAHNNYLLFFIEGGIVGITLYLLFQINLFIFLLKKIRENPSIKIFKIAFLMFLSIDLFSFLQNNYYFYCSESIVWMTYGLAFGKNKELNYNYS